MQLTDETMGTNTRSEIMKPRIRLELACEHLTASDPERRPYLLCALHRVGNAFGALAQHPLLIANQVQLPGTGQSA